FVLKSFMRDLLFVIVLLLLQSYKKEVSFSRETPRLHKIFYAMHLSTCIGDFYLINQLLKAPKDVMVEDTEKGITLYL
ncbi:hypothetical protein ACWOBV_11295, partial [Globicatella sanguinis]